MLYNFAADSFYIMKLCSRLFVLHCRSRPKYDRSRHFDPHFQEVGGGVEPWSMARWKALAEFLLSVIELLFYLLRLRQYKANYVKTRCLQEVVDQLEPRFQGEGVDPGEYFLVSTKLDTFCYLTVQTALCYYAMCRRFDTIPACDRQTDRRTDRQTDGRKCCS